MIVMDISITIPQDANLILKVGDRIDFNVPFYRLKKSEDVRVDIAHKIEVPPAKIFKYLKKFVSDKIEKGELLAEHASLFGKKQAVSEVNGEIKEINHNEGVIVISTVVGEGEEKKTYFTGEISAVEKSQIKLKVKEFHEYELKDKENQRDFGGKVLYTVKDDDSTISEDKVRAAVIVDETISPYLKVKLEALGVAGFVSLQPLTEKTTLPMAEVKAVTDWKKIITTKLPYCIVEYKTNKIVFYQ